MDHEGKTAERIQNLADRLQIISGTVRAFAEATTDYERLLVIVAERLGEIVRDGCVVRLLTEGGWLTPVAIHMPFAAKIADPARAAQVVEHIARPQHVTTHEGGRRVIETGEPLLVPKLDLEPLRSTMSPEVFEAYEAIGIHSLLLVALRARGQSLGMLGLVRFDRNSPPFSEQDRDLAQILADNAALAISNARLFQAAVRELAERERAEALLRKTEEQLRHSQKMEAVGRLAGSVAHDFNNLLSVILAHGSFMLEDLKQADPMRTEVTSIMKAGHGAAELTRQLLAFSRQQVMAPRVLDLNGLVQESETMLRRLLGEDVEFVTRCDRSLSKIKADPGQIEQVIMNLAINARDAMPQGGKLTIETKNVMLDDTYTTEHFGVVSGPHVMLAVSDTGAGMSKEVQARIFEPFFTTKELGKGTGLGLSTVFGIVRQSGGYIWVYSEPGRGTTFKVYFPRATEVDVEPEPIPEPVTLEGTETILLVEDQDEVRHVAMLSLRRYGYHVIEARNAGEALLTCEMHPRTIHLLLSDVVMPQMSGRRLAERLVQTRPEMKVLFMSGYTENAIVHHGILDSGIAYLQKPLLPEALARRVREVLDAPLRKPAK